MHAARAIRNQRQQPAQVKPNRKAKSPGGCKDLSADRQRSAATDSTCTINDEKTEWKSRTFSRDSDESSFYGKSDKKIEPVVWGKCFCLLGVIVTIIGLVLLLVGMTNDFRPMPFVFGVFCTIAGVLVLMFGICFVKAAEHWPEVNRGRVGSVFIISDEVEKKDFATNEHRDDDVVKVLTVESAPKLEFVNEHKGDNSKELPGTVYRSTDET